MKILILGGTLFLGRHLVEAAQASGHRVTIFHRGKTNPDLYSHVESLRGDRDGDLNALHGRQWDAVIDTSGYVPRLVGATATLLADAVDHYTFISSGSVYADFSVSGLDEDAPLKLLDDETTEDVSTAYGGLKALCEQTVESILPGRVLTVRSGLLVGPYDPTNRFDYWLYRFERGGQVLAPGQPQRPIQLIHAQDMAQWIIRMIEAQHTGTFNVTGPAEQLTMENFLEACHAVIGSKALLEWVDEKFLMEHEVAPFTDLPLWLPTALNGMLEMNIERALNAGLTCRPLTDTIQETVDWLSRSDDGRQLGTLASGVSGDAGLTAEREADLLAQWVSGKASSKDLA